MAYPDTYEDCTVLAQIDTLEIVDYARIQEMITVSQDYLCQCSVDSSSITNSKLDAVEGGIKQILVEVLEEVNENQQFIEPKTGFKIII